MAFDGTGTFNVIYNWTADQAATILVRADRMDVQDADIATGLSNCLTRDGQSLPLANIPMGGFRFTGLGNGLSTTDSVNYAQVFVSPAFTGTPTAPTATPGTSTTQIATTAFATALAFATVLPAQPGGTVPYWLRSVGGVAGWNSNPTPDFLLIAQGII